MSSDTPPKSSDTPPMSPGTPPTAQDVPDDEVLHRNAVIVRDAAGARGLHIHIRRFPEGTKTAADAANAIGVQVGQIVKSLVFAVGDPADRSTGELVMALVAGHNQLDERKLAAAAGCAGSWRVDADAVRAATGFPIGGVAPLGHATALRIFVDPDLLGFDEVWSAAGTWEHVFGAAPAALVDAVGGTVVELRRH